MSTDAQLLQRWLKDEDNAELSKIFTEYDASGNKLRVYKTFPQYDVGQQCLARYFSYDDANNTTLVTGETTDLATWTQTMEDGTEPNPTDISLSRTIILESLSIGSTAATISGTGGTGALTFSLVDSAGGAFAISGTNLTVNATLSAASSPYSITIRATDVIGKTYDEVFSITVQAFSNTKSITFDGVNEKITIPTAATIQLDRDEAHTLALWVKTTAVSGNDILFTSRATSSSVGVNLKLDSGSQRLVYEWKDSGGSISQVITPNTSILSNSWYHIVITVDGSGTITNSKIYINGVSQSLTVTANNVSLTISSSADWTIGSESNSFYFLGNFDLFSIYNKELSASEVTQLYGGGIPTDPAAISGIQHLWLIGDGDTITSGGIIDSIASLNGSPTNMAAGNIVTDAPS